MLKTDTAGLRTHDAQGHQLVVVNDRYTYHWTGAPLKVNDKVVLPGNGEVWSGPWHGVVTAISTAYTGWTVGIIAHEVD